MFSTFYVMKQHILLEHNLTRYFETTHRAGKQLYHTSHSFLIYSGLKENPLAPHSDSLRIIKILDEAKKQIGLVYYGDIS